MLVDLTPKNITGPGRGDRPRRAGITVNKNSIPWDQKPPVTTERHPARDAAGHDRGMKEHEMNLVGDLICEALANGHDREPALPRCG